MKKQPKWTSENSFEAYKMGFDVFWCNDDKLRIQRIDDPKGVAADLKEMNDITIEIPSLTSDLAALNLVKKQAAEGNKTCIFALELHGTKVRRLKKKK